MFKCDACGTETTFMSLLGNLALCERCTEPYFRELAGCRSMREYDQLVRRIRAEVAKKGNVKTEAEVI